MIKVRCHTNLDRFAKENWPTQMHNPKVGDWVESESGKRLLIESIVHLYDNQNVPTMAPIKTVLEIELYWPKSNNFGPK